MKILYAASEAAPFAKSGGLADVAGALPKALVRDGIDARVVMPLYGDLKFKDTLTYVTNFSVPVGWRSQYCGLFKAERDGVVFYFIDNEYYFKRISSAASRRYSRSTTLPTRVSMVWIFSRIPAASAHVTPMLWSMTAAPTL